MKEADLSSSAGHVPRFLEPRPPEGHKGTYGHAWSSPVRRGKTGAATMSGLAALRAGAGLVTVASAESAIPAIPSTPPS